MRRNCFGCLKHGIHNDRTHFSALFGQCLGHCPAVSVRVTSSNDEAIVHLMTNDLDPGTQHDAVLFWCFLFPTLKQSREISVPQNWPSWISQNMQHFASINYQQISTFLGAELPGLQIQLCLGCRVKVSSSTGLPQISLKPTMRCHGELDIWMRFDDFGGKFAVFSRGLQEHWWI